MNEKSKVGRPQVGRPISITLTDEQREWIDKRAQESGRSRSDVIRQLIREAMNDIGI